MVKKDVLLRRTKNKKNKIKKYPLQRKQEPKNNETAEKLSKSKIPISVRGTGGTGAVDRTLKVKEFTVFCHKPCPKPKPCAAVLGSSICICTN